MNLMNHITLNKKVTESPNITGMFKPEDLGAIATTVWDGYDKDKRSRSAWEQRMDAAINLAMQYTEQKSFPWPGASNVAFPLVTIAALQYHSRAYPAIIPGRNIVRCRVVGDDPQGEEVARATRIGEHMSFQMMDESEDWEAGMDRSLFIQAIVGSVFKKTYRDGMKRCNTSDVVQAKDLVFDYYATSVEACRRKTHVFTLWRNDIHEGAMAGVYADVRNEAWYASPAVTKHDETDAARDSRLGTNPPQSDESTPFTILEQHVWLDLDGDGYEEPWIISMEFNSKRVIRIVAGWDKWSDVQLTETGEIARITATQYFTGYELIPSPDGGALGLGFGILLGPLNASVDSIVNQLIDAGTLSNTAGGFITRGAKIRGGNMSFAPMEWKRVDVTGDDLKKSIFPLPVREPSMVLFQLLGLLIEYTNKVSGATDMLTGMNPGQNTPAYTTDQMVEQGMKIYSAIFKRTWRSLRSEMQKWARLNSIYIGSSNITYCDGKIIKPTDYSGDLSRIIPIADPNVMSQQHRFQRAMELKRAASTTPGYNVEEVEKRFLRALDIENIDLIYPGASKTGGMENPKVEIEKMKAQLKQQELQLNAQMFAAELIETRRLNQAKILQLEASAAKLMAEANGAEIGHEIAAFEAAIGALKTHDDTLRGHVDMLLKGMKTHHEITTNPTPIQ